MPMFCKKLCSEAAFYPPRFNNDVLAQGDLSQHPPDSEAQQAAVTEIAAEDAFNWGYDPVHWSTPEGSYASNPDGPTRILEYRTMVQALHDMGLRVVFDTVYNHTFHSGVDGACACVYGIRCLCDGESVYVSRGGALCMLVCLHV